jgi:hypothetical protein
MEQLVMVLVFALAAALCLRCFVRSDQMSQRNALRDEAVLCVQSAAETLKGCGGDYEQAARLMNGQWDGGKVTVQAHEGCTLLILPKETDDPLLGSADIEVYCLQGNELLFGLTVAWQEVDSDG